MGGLDLDQYYIKRRVHNTCTTDLSVIIIDGRLYKKSEKVNFRVKMLFPVFTLPFTAEAVRKLTHFKYFYCDYFTVIRIHSSAANPYRENELMIFTY